MKVIPQASLIVVHKPEGINHLKNRYCEQAEYCCALDVNKPARDNIIDKCEHFGRTASWVKTCTK